MLFGVTFGKIPVTGSFAGFTKLFAKIKPVKAP